MAATPFLDVRGLTLSYKTGKTQLTAVNKVSFTIEKPGQALAIVGESGCGKSSLALAIMRVLPQNVSPLSGEVRLEGEDILQLPLSDMRDRYSWKKISWVPQSITAVFNPVYKIGKQLQETLAVHDETLRKYRWFTKPLRKLLKAKEYRREAIRLLETSGLAAEHAQQYPHQLSGGMQQRACIAMALTLRSPLIILDEPTSALDVSLQGEIINLLNDLKEEFSLSYIFITHNIVLATKLCDQLAVIYGGRIVELGPMQSVIASPGHPYTKALLACVPTFDQNQRVAAIPGEPPDLRNDAQGCPFAERPAVRCARCSNEQTPELLEISKGHFVACHGVARCTKAQ